MVAAAAISTGMILRLRMPGVSTVSEAPRNSEEAAVMQRVQNRCSRTWHADAELNRLFRLENGRPGVPVAEDSAAARLSAGRR